MTMLSGPLAYTHTQESCGSSTTELAAENEKRLYLLIQNVSDEIVDIKIGADAVATEGIRLYPVDADAHLPRDFVMSAAEGNLSHAAINGICVSGSKDVNVTSGE